ncbi:MAG: twin-arginine translocase TatA/TatE family subunit [Chloroflexi bacterium]|nr:twin-arginine translocase TatA/TatE family subunit [Chloroflexota bacterium]
MGALQPLHLLLLLGLILLIFGPRRLVATGRALGQSWRALVAGWRQGQSAGPALLARPCPRCGQWSTESARYCTACGAALPS